jgi:dipeptidyl aminopeptidase/acylaminoacyl peptidase
MSALQRVLAGALLGLLLACGDDPGTGPEEGVVIRVEVTPSGAELASGETKQLQATAYTATGAVQRTIAWSSSDTSVVRVDAQGRVHTGSRLGSATIRATIEGVTGEATLKVFRWDLMFFALSGTFAETLVMPFDAVGFPQRIFPIGRFAMDAAPSPDGTRVAYAVRSIEGYTTLWIADRDGSNARALTSGTDANDMWPAWSPDGSRIAFQSDRSGGLDDIYVIRVDGTGLLRLTYDPVPGITNEVHPAWSPDGSRIAFTSNVAGHYDLYTIRPDGSDLTRITSTIDSDLEPSWSPDGNRLVVRRVTPDNEWDIWLMDADGSDALRVPLPGYQQAPSWRADGAVITFTSRPGLGQPWQIWTMRADGSNPRQQTPDSFTGGYRPMWLKRD